MPEYTADRWFATRAAYRVKFEAEDDEAAKAHLATIDWTVDGEYLSSANLDDEDIDDDALISLQREDEHDDYIFDNEPVTEARPYGWDAKQFAQNVAAMTRYGDGPGFHGTGADAIDTLNRLIQEARKICGQPEMSNDERIDGLPPDFDGKQCLAEGWQLTWSDSRDSWEIQKDDNRPTFESDEAAVAFVWHRARAGSAYHAKALEIVNAESAA